MVAHAETFFHAKDLSLATLKRDNPALCAPTAIGPIEKWEEHKTVREVRKVDVVAFDPVRRIAVVRPAGPFLAVESRLGILDLGLDAERQAILDPLVIDFFLKSGCCPR